MTTVLAIGTGPLLEKGVRKIGGQCLRTWHLVKPLLDTGHRVRLVTLPIPDLDASPAGGGAPEEKEYKDFKYLALPTNNPDVARAEIKKIYSAARPDCVIGINQMPSGVACSIGADAPVWVDLNGYAMAEGQTKARIYDDDSFLSHFWRMERVCLLRADKFSTVSEPQYHALLGELAAAGRLNKYTFDYRFGGTIPNAVNEMFVEPAGIDASYRLRGNVVPEDAFVVLWSGGFNTWTDTKTLLRALSDAMKREPRVHFVSTGGMVDGHDEVTYTAFQRGVEESDFTSRFHLLGWIEASLLPGYYRECDVGINIDSFNYETIFGARNRLLNMMAAGLPVITTRGTEISRIIDRRQLGLVFDIGDVDDLADLIVSLAQTGSSLEETGTRARDYVLRNFSYEATTNALREWTAAPTHAPDHAARIVKAGKDKRWQEIVLNDLEKEQRALSAISIDDLLEANASLQAIRDKKTYRILKGIKNIFFPGEKPPKRLE